MNDQNENETKELNLIFVGSTQAGKTTLACFWYHHCIKEYSLVPEENDSETLEFLEKKYEPFVKEGTIDPTAKGSKTKAVFRGTAGNWKFRLNLSDYSGEDVRAALTHKETDDPEKGYESELHQNIRATTTNADLVVLVTNAQSFLKGSDEDRSYARRIWLSLEREFRKSKTRFVHYLSHADQLTEDELEDVREQLQENDEGQKSKHTVETGGAAVKTDSGSYRIAKPDDPFSPREFVSRNMARMTSWKTPRSRENESREFFLKTLLGLWKDHPMWAALAIALILGLIAYEILTPEPGELTWDQHKEALGEIHKESNESLPYAKARQGLRELDDWNQTASEKFDTKFRGDKEALAWFTQSKERFEKVPAPKGLKKVVDEITGVKNEFAPLNDAGTLKRFYEKLRELARKSKSQTTQYERLARTEWEEVENFASLMLDDGIKIDFGGRQESWLAGPDSQFNDENLRMEIWLTVATKMSKPFDEDDEEGDFPTGKVICLPASGREPKSVEAMNKDDRLSWTWQPIMADQQPALTWRAGNNLWLRYFEFEWADNEMYFYQQIPSATFLGPLDWLNKNQTMTRSELRGRVSVKFEPDPREEAPASLLKAFSEYD
jgi:hypothetical protein